VKEVERNLRLYIFVCHPTILNPLFKMVLKKARSTNDAANSTGYCFISMLTNEKIC
jgi:flavin reductase (DIM6/NTAB) family NADH-FMN oxidoreductase RutF